MFPTPTFAGGSVISLKQGFDASRFYRHNISGSETLTLVVGLGRSAATGFSSAESWETASGAFALPAQPSLQVARQFAIDKIKAAWVADPSATQAELTAAINAALTSAGYRRSDGSAIV